MPPGVLHREAEGSNMKTENTNKLTPALNRDLDELPSFAAWYTWTCCAAGGLRNAIPKPHKTAGADAAKAICAPSASAEYFERFAWMWNKLKGGKA
tara:strand:- start:243 stop:530 length:288 start_codon:yes stop_codon:yes gene_type:complete